MFKEHPGFEAYRTVDGNGKVVSVSIWDTQENADDANQKAREWVRENVGDRISVRDAIVGEVTELG